MIRGDYTSVSGLVAAQERMDLLADNIANASTTGFKQLLSTQGGTGLEVGVTTGLGDWAAMGDLTLGTVADGLEIDHAQGPLLESGKLTDLALSGDGLFVVGTPSGPAYTRDGSFVRDAAGTLVTQQGYPVLDTTGRPVVVPDGDFAVSRDGTISGTGQRLALAAFPATGVARLGENLYAISGAVTPLAPGAGQVRQGALEGSNVDMGAAMSELIAVQRSFQFAARSLVIQDETLADTNQLGTLRG